MTARAPLSAALVLALAGAGCRPAPPPAASTAPPRVVSLAPSLTEIIGAIGALDVLVGRTTVCNYPPAVSNVAVIGNFGEPSLEALLKVRPTLILDVALADEALAAKLERTGLRRTRVPCARLDDIPAAIRAVGGLLGRPSAAEPLAQRLSARIAGLRIAAAAMTNRPAVFIEIWHDPVMTVGRGAFLSELVGLAGGRNLGDEVDKDYFTVSAEWVVARNPDIILCFYMSDPDLPGRFRRRAGWEGTRAVRDGRICAGFDNDALLRPGPRVLEGIEALRACIRPGSPDG